MTRTTTYRRLSTAALWLLLLPVAGLAGGEHDHGAPSPGGSAKHAEHEDSVALPDSVLAEFGVTVAEAGPGAIVRTVSLPAEVRPDEDRLVHLVPRFAGVAIEVRASVGDRVRAGRVLAVLESDLSLSPYRLTTAQGGTVIQRHLSVGEHVDRDRTVFVVADLDTVWVDLTVFQRHLDDVAVGRRVIVHSERRGATAEGRIVFVSPVLDERTRTGTARVVLDNRDRRWFPGMFVTADVVVDTLHAPVAVPRSAVQYLEEEPVVFVRDDDGDFAPRAVVLGESDHRLLAVTAGLAPGERYAATGGFVLKSELAKAAFGDGHAH